MHAGRLLACIRVSQKITLQSIYFGLCVSRFNENCSEEKSEGRRSRGTTRHRRMGNIERDHKETAWKGMECSLAEDRNKWQTVLNTIINFQVP